MPTGDTEIIASEQAHLDRIYKEAEALVHRLEEAAPVADAAAGRAVGGDRRDRRELLLAALEDARQLIAFGRIDFGAGEHGGRTVYVGRVLVGDEGSDYPLLVSWRAKLAAAFYNPLGFEDGRSVELKRALRGANRRIDDVIDEQPLELAARREEKAIVDRPPVTPQDTPAPPAPSDRRPSRTPSRGIPRRDRSERRPEVPIHDVAPRATPPAPEPARREPEPIAASGAPTLVDPLVDRLRARSGTRLDAIIETIQARQYELMERPLDRTLVIQGGPGTGKTVIALHRVAVQLFRSFGQLAENDILFVGPSRTFIGYVDQVLPGLGERQVVHRAIEDLASHDVDPSSHDPSDVALVKGLPQMVEVIDRYLRSRARVPSRAAEVGTGVLAAVPSEAVEAVLARAQVEARDYGELRTRFRRLLASDAVQRDLMAAATSKAAAASETPVRTPPRLEPRLADALARSVVPTVSPRDAVHGLLTSPDLLEGAAEGLLTAAQQATIRRRADSIQQHPWTFEDLQLLDEAAAQLGPDRRPLRYAHVVIDEAQDFSAMQLRMIRRRSAGSLTILGDLAQATTGWRPETWEEHLGSAGIEADDLEELTDSYRTTAPILETANLLLDVIDLGLRPPRSIITGGEDVQFEALGDPAEDGDRISAHVRDIQATARSGDTIGIIGPGTTLERIAPDLTAAGHDVTWVADDVSAPIVLVPVDAAKGLEYDHVILVEPERIYRSDAATGARKLYVAMTRARATLRMLHRDRLPRVLAAPLDAAPDDAPDAASVSEPPPPTSEPGLTEPDLPARLRARGGGVPDDPAASTDAGPPGPCRIPTGGGTVVLTDHPGTDRRDLIVHAERLGFAVRPDVTPATTLVIVGRIDSRSRRARLARQLGVPLGSAADLLAARPGDEIPAERQPPSA